MTKDLALQLINAQEYEDLEDAWDMFFFNLKQELLQLPFASKLIRLKQKKIAQAIDIENEIFPGKSKPESGVLNNLEEPGMSEILQNQSRIKLQIHQASSPAELAICITDYDLLAEQYELYIYRNLRPFPQKDKEVPYKNVMDIMEIIRELEQVHQLKDEEKKKLGKFEEKFPGLWHEFQRVKNHINQELIA